MCSQPCFLEGIWEEQSSSCRIPESLWIWKQNSKRHSDHMGEIRSNYLRPFQDSWTSSGNHKLHSHTLAYFCLPNSGRGEVDPQGKFRQMPKNIYFECKIWKKLRRNFPGLRRSFPSLRRNFPGLWPNSPVPKTGSSLNRNVQDYESHPGSNQHTYLPKAFRRQIFLKRKDACCGILTPCSLEWSGQAEPKVPQWL